jgi:hypothetical protein
VLRQGRPIWDIEAALEPLAGLSALLLVELLVAWELRHSVSQIVLGVQLLLGREIAVEHCISYAAGLAPVDIHAELDSNIEASDLR